MQVRVEILKMGDGGRRQTGGGSGWGRRTPGNYRRGFETFRIKRKGSAGVWFVTFMLYTAHKILFA